MYGNGYRRTAIISGAAAGLYGQKYSVLPEGVSTAWEEKHPTARSLTGFKLPELQLQARPPHVALGLVSDLLQLFCYKMLKRRGMADFPVPGDCLASELGFSTLSPLEVTGWL